MKKILSFIICLVIVAASAFGGVVGKTSALEAYDFGKLAEKSLAYFAAKAGANSAQQYINGYLAQNAGTMSEWSVVALSRMDKELDFSLYAESLTDYVKNNSVPGATKRQLYSLSFMFAGDTENDYIRQTMSDSIGELGIMSYIFGLHLLNNGYTSEKHSVASVTEKLLSAHMSDGGWALYGTVSDVDVTAMTLQALSPQYRTDPKVKSACDAAVALLSKRQNDDGCYSSFGVKNPESTAQAAIALSSLGINCHTDSRFIKNGLSVIDGILKFSLGDGSFSHTENGTYNFMATVQAMSAFIAMKRLEEDAPCFYINDAYITGDINGDMTVDSADAVMALKADVSLVTLSYRQKKVGDINHDEDIDSFDAAVILKYDAGLILSFK